MIMQNEIIHSNVLVCTDVLYVRCIVDNLEL
jgi:hypothetical protein